MNLGKSVKFPYWQKSNIGINTFFPSLLMYRNRNRNKFINQIRAPGGHIQITIMIDTQLQYKSQL